MFSEDNDMYHGLIQFESLEFFVGWKSLLLFNFQVFFCTLTFQSKLAKHLVSHIFMTHWEASLRPTFFEYLPREFIRISKDTFRVLCRISLSFQLFHQNQWIVKIFSNGKYLKTNCQQTSGCLDKKKRVLIDVSHST